MPIFNIFVIAILVASVGLCSVSVSRVMTYNKRYTLPENKYTRLFRIINKEQITVAYMFFTLAHTVFTIWFLITL